MSVKLILVGLLVLVSAATVIFGTVGFTPTPVLVKKEFSLSAPSE